MKKILAILILSAMSIGASAQCVISSEVKKGQFDVVFPKDRLVNGDKKTVDGKLGETLYEVVEIKFPNKLSEIKKRSDIIECDGITMLPGASKIHDIQIKSIKNLPPGLRWSMDNADKKYDGGTTGCLYLKGKSTKKGTYKLNVNVEGKGGLFGITQNVTCRMNNYKLIVN